MKLLLRKRRPASGEDGFTLVEVMLVVTLLGLIAGVIAGAFIVSLRGNDKVKTLLPAANAANSVNFWLASDVSSAVTNIPGWFSSTAADSSGCSSDPPGTTNVLRIETRDPIAGTQLYFASYRYQASTASLWRTFCRSGQAPAASSVLAEDIDPNPLKAPAAGPAATDTASISFSVISRGVSRRIVAKAAIRTQPAAPAIATSTTTTLAPIPICKYTAGSGGSGTKPTGTKSLNLPLPIVSVTSNMSAGGGCTVLVVKVPANGNAECVLTRQGVTDVWMASCFGSPLKGNTLPTMDPVLVYDRVDPGDAAAAPPVPPTDVQVPGSPALSLLVTTV